MNEVGQAVGQWLRCLYDNPWRWPLIQLSAHTDPRKQGGWVPDTHMEDLDRVLAPGLSLTQPQPQP